MKIAILDILYFWHQLLYPFLELPSNKTSTLLFVSVFKVYFTRQLREVYKLIFLFLGYDSYKSKFLHFHQGVLLAIQST